MNTVLAKVFIIETSNEHTNKKGEIMGKIWDILQVIFGLLGVWLILDMSLEGLSFTLWVNGFFVGLGGWLGPFAILAYIIAVIVILQLIKALLRDD